MSPASDRKPGEAWIITDDFEGVDRRKKPRHGLDGEKRPSRAWVILVLALAAFLTLAADIDSQHTSCLRANDIRSALEVYMRDQSEGLVLRNELPGVTQSEKALNLFRMRQINANRTLLSALDCSGLRPATEGTTEDNLPEPQPPTP